MTNKTITILFILFSSLTLINGQNIDKYYITEWIEKVYPIENIDSNLIYIINGQMISDSDLDSTIKAISPLDLVSIQYLDSKTDLKETILCANKSCVLIITSNVQKRHIVRKKYRLIKKKIRTLKKEYLTEEEINNNLPAVVIDWNQVNYNVALEYMDGVRIRKIKGIDFIDKNLNTEEYGEPAKNGLILILSKNNNSL